MTKIIFISGSIRKDSANKKLAKLACKISNQINGVDAEYIDLSDYEMPIYNEDIENESGLPETVKKLKRIFEEADGLFIASPEYNSSFSPLLKNTIDWLSRDGGESKKPLSAFQGKIVAISSASPGGLGGLRGLVPLRMLLENIAMIVIPNQLAISASFNAFNDDGDLKDENQKNTLTQIVQKLADTTTKLK